MVWDPTFHSLPAEKVKGGEGGDDPPAVWVWAVVGVGAVALVGGLWSCYKVKCRAKNGKMPATGRGRMIA